MEPLHRAHDLPTDSHSPAPSQTNGSAASQNGHAHEVESHDAEMQVDHEEFDALEVPPIIEQVGDEETEIEDALEPSQANTSASQLFAPARSSRVDDYNDFDTLFAQWKETGDPKLRERLIFMHRNLVTYLARKFVDRGELFEDVIQIGMVGLINALDNFDPSRGYKFSTFAIPTISGEIRRYFRDKVAGMRVPRRLQELYLTLQSHVETLTHRLNRAPTYVEIAQSLQIEVEEVVEALELGSALEPSSLDDFMFSDSESGSVADSVGAPDPQLQAYEEHAALQAALEKLTAKERRVLEMTYFDGFSQAEVARRLGVSQMHISRLLRRALSQLRQLLEEV